MTLLFHFVFRPTLKASWNDAEGFKSHFLGGRDLAKGKENGTWLGVDRKGRLAALTNISVGDIYTGSGAAATDSPKGRGYLVPNFLASQLSGPSYLTSLSNSNDCYNPFNLLTLEPRGPKGAYLGWIYCRGKPGHIVASEAPAPVSVDADGFLGLSNHPPQAPFQKTIAGLKNFRQAVTNMPKSFFSENAFMEMARQMIESSLCDRTTYPDDPQLKLQTQEGLKNIPFYEEIRRRLSSVYVNLPRFDYGTRTQTLVAVDYEWNITFYERNRTGVNGKWDELVHHFKANPVQDAQGEV